MSSRMHRPESLPIALVLDLAAHLLTLLRVSLLPGLPVATLQALESRVNPLLSPQSGANRIVVSTHDHGLESGHMRVVLSDPFVQGGNVVVARVTPVLIDVRVAQAPGDGLRDVERLLHFGLVQPVRDVVVLALQLRNFLGGRVEPEVVCECVLLRERPLGQFGEGQDGVGGAGREVHALNEDVLVGSHDGVGQVLAHVSVGAAGVRHAGALPCSPVGVREQSMSVEGGHESLALFGWVGIGIAQKEALKVERRVLLCLELI